MTETKNVLYVHSGCHGSHWFLIEIDGRMSLYCVDCFEPFVAGMEDVEFLAEPLRQPVDGEIFVMPPSRTAWEWEVDGKSSFLSCRKAKTRYVTFTTPFDDLECESCAAEEMKASNVQHLI